jgi:hypothetical protein
LDLLAEDLAALIGIFRAGTGDLAHQFAGVGLHHRSEPTMKRQGRLRLSVLVTPPRGTPRVAALPQRALRHGT